MGAFPEGACVLVLGQATAKRLRAGASTDPRAAPVVSEEDVAYSGLLSGRCLLLLWAHDAQPPRLHGLYACK